MQASWSKCLEDVVPNIRSWEDGLTPLQAAIALGNEDAAKDLVGIPVDINAVEDQGFTTLHYCIALQHPRNAILSVLLDHAADLSIQDRNGRTPLHLAAHQISWGSEDYIEMLLNVMEPASINLPDVNGNTALHVAIMSRNKAVVMALLDAGAELNVENHQGKTAIELARSLGFMVTDFNDVFGDANELLFEESGIGAIHADDQLEGPTGKPKLGWRDGSGPLDDEDGDTSSSDSQSRDDDSAMRSTWSMSLDLVAQENSLSFSAKPLDPVDDKLPTEEVDLYSSYGVDNWTILSGTANVPLRSVDGIFR